ncbi:FAD binding domain-containing protein [Mastigocoleus testarum]|uniref:FAD-binding PCMH-type domain-containing protein n=1 Tax=Mastigocoleus testarum BC008 TaxID=371196 RepID=A0A0V7ZN69_9CYAN|nr:FAD binding domain-containing protein [Mastigocoleus testarum]KST65718.1 hypothetical protein BC008_22340 [Mastigocoleus testarum BC008]
MIPVKFDYIAPESLEAAVKLLEENEGSQVLAGGHSLLMEMKLGQVFPSLLVDLGKIKGLQGVRFSHEMDGIVQIGAMTSYSEVATALKDKENYEAIVEAAISIGDPQIRNWVKIGDTFAYRDLACDLLAVALALEATFNIIDPSGIRAVSADEFISGYSDNTLKSSEIIVSIDFPHHGIGTGSAYEAFKHPATKYSICGLAVLVRLSSNGIVDKCRVVVTGARENTSRLLQVETALEGKAPTQENIEAASKFASKSLNKTKEGRKELSNISNFYTSTEYRNYISSVLTARALTRATERIDLALKDDPS